MNLDELAQKVSKVSSERVVQDLSRFLIEWKSNDETVEELNTWIEIDEEHEKIYQMWSEFRDEAISGIGGRSMIGRLYWFDLIERYDACPNQEAQLVIYRKLHVCMANYQSRGDYGLKLFSTADRHGRLKAEAVSPRKPRGETVYPTSVSARGDTKRASERGVESSRELATESQRAKRCCDGVPVTGTAGAQSAVEDRVRKGDWDVPFRITRSKTHLFKLFVAIHGQDRFAGRTNNASGALDEGPAKCFDFAETPKCRPFGRGSTSTRRHLNL